MKKFRKIEDRKEWQELLNKVLFKTFFHTLEWEEFLEKNFNWLRFDRYLYKDEVILSLAKYRIFGKEKLISHPFCEYGGPLSLKNEIDGFSFKKDLFENFKNPFKISFHPYLPKYFKNLQLKEPDSSRDAYFIENFDKKTPDQILSSFRKNLRYLIKKTQDKNLVIKRCETKEELQTFYNLYLKTIKKHQSIPYPASFFKFFLENRGEIRLAKFKNKIIAGSLFLFYAGFIHYFLNASHEKFKRLNVNHLILWNQIESWAGKNYQVFDLGGTKRGSSLEIFKRGWGAQRYPIFELRNYLVEKFKQSKLRNIFDFLPTFLIKEFSPYLLKYKL